MVKLKASTLVEVLVAMLIISAVTTVWTTLFLRINAHGNLQQQDCGKELFQEAKNIAQPTLFEIDCKGETWSVSVTKEGENLLFVQVVSLNFRPEVKYQALISP